MAHLLHRSVAIPGKDDHVYDIYLYFSRKSGAEKNQK
jgi:hypothetical protein